MGQNLYFYDLETSGINPRSSRIMQFAGQRTDLQLKPVAEPDVFYIKLTDDVLPEPDAILVTGITPQKSRADGITEVEFMRYFSQSIALADTIFVGFNNVRFDDEFIRFIHYRNFYDAYEWAWKDGRSRWDILDLVRMTRALRPDGIEWPFDSSGKPSCRLELMTSVNGLDHADAHDALSDVQATIALARLIRNKQPKLFDYLLKMRDKKEIANLVNSGKPFIYSSGKYPSLYLKTAMVVSLGEHPGKQGALVYDLRTDPDDFVNLTPAELAVRWQEIVDDETKRFPVKTLQFNRCPAVAPSSVLDNDSKQRLQIDQEKVKQNLAKLKSAKDFYQKLLAALKIMDKKQQARLIASEQEADTQLYDGFFEDPDRKLMSVVRAAEQEDVTSLDVEFQDDRLNKLLPLYKARNYPESLSQEERASWEAFRTERLLGGGNSSQAAKFFTRLQELSENPLLTPEKRYLLEELQLYAESILPLELA